MKRTTTQSLLPIENYNVDEPTYNPYPSFELKNGTIFQGYETLSTTISDKKVVFLEGYLGVDWEEVIQNLKTELTQKGLSVESIDIRDYMKADSDIYQMVKPFLGKEDSIFGYKTNLNLIDFFKSDELENLQINPANDITLIYGTGSSLCKLDGFLVYFDLPKMNCNIECVLKKSSILVTDSQTTQKPSTRGGSILLIGLYSISTKSICCPVLILSSTNKDRCTPPLGHRVRYFVKI